MAIDLNFSGVDRPSFSPVPEDDYDLVVTDFTLKPGKADPSKVIAHCVFEIQGGEYDGRKVWHYQGITGDNLPYAKVMFEAFVGEPLTSDFSLDEDEIVGITFRAHVGVQPDNRDNTKQQNKISYFILPFDTE